MSHIWVSHVPHISHIWVGHVTRMSESHHAYEWLMSHIRLIRVWVECVMAHIWVSHVYTCEWVMSHICASHISIWVSHVTRMREWRFTEWSYHTYGWVMSHLGVEWVMSHIWVSHEYMSEVPNIDKSLDDKWLKLKSHGTNINESWHTYDQVMSHIWVSHVTHISQSYHALERSMSHIWVIHLWVKWVIAHVWVSHVHTCEWVMSHMWVSYEYRVAKTHRIP